MTNFEHMYILDNNSLAYLKERQRTTKFFREKCRIPEEVLYEARGFPDIEKLKEIEYPTTGRLLWILREIMATVPTTDRDLVDLYANRGNADPLVVACAIDGQRQNNDALFGPTWIVVTGDKAVKAKAEEFGIGVRTNRDFVDILEERSSEESHVWEEQ